MSHPPYSPDLAPSDFHLFGPLKDYLRGQRFKTDAEVKRAVRSWVNDTESGFFSEPDLGVGWNAGKSGSRWTVTGLRSSVEGEMFKYNCVKV